MPFVESESLRARLARAGELPVAGVIRVLRDISYAPPRAPERRRARDVESLNLLLDGGHAVVIDLGVGRALAASSSRRPR
jgi:serine/threonine-protein kinase